MRCSCSFQVLIGPETVLAALVLKEKVGIRRIGAILVGLLGAVIILRPNLAEIGLAQRDSSSAFNGEG